jgi:hypothetical protein
LDDLSRRDGLYGTIEAFSTFIKRTDFRCLVLTGPSASNCMLYREMSPYVETLLRNLVESPVQIFELADALLPRYAQKNLSTPSTRRTIPSFL